MTIQSPAPAIHKIVERFIVTVTVDEIEWDCYGTRGQGEAPEVIQIALAGSMIDLFHSLSNSRVRDIQSACERLWLDGAFDNSEFYKSLTKEPE